MQVPFTVTMTSFQYDTTPGYSGIYAGESGLVRALQPDSHYLTGDGAYGLYLGTCGPVQNKTYVKSHDPMCVDS